MSIPFEHGNNALPSFRVDEPVQEGSGQVHVAHASAEQRGRWIQKGVIRIVVSAFAIYLESVKNLRRSGQCSIPVRERVFLQPRGCLQGLPREIGVLVIPLRVVTWPIAIKIWRSGKQLRTAWVSVTQHPGT